MGIARKGRKEADERRPLATTPRRFAPSRTLFRHTGLRLDEVLLQRTAGNQAVQRLVNGYRRNSEVQSVDVADAWGSAVRGGVHAPAGPLPHLQRLQTLFGRHDLEGVEAHTGEAAAASAAAINAKAYTVGNHVVFARPPDVWTAAHEAAHVVQQRGGVHLPDAFGEQGDQYERHADAVADAVSAGRSAERLLDGVAGQGGAAGLTPGVVQRVSDKDVEAILTAIRKAASAWSLPIRTLGLPSGRKDFAAFWVTLQAMADDAETLGAMDVKQAAALFLDKMAAAAPALPQEPAAQRDFGPPITLEGRGGKPIEFTVEGLGRGRVVLFLSDNRRDPGALVWFSHGIQASDNTHPSPQERRFGFVVGPNEKMIRPELDKGDNAPQDPVSALVGDMAANGDRIPAQRSVPDMYVGAHLQTEFQGRSATAAAAALATCDVAILDDFIPLPPSQAAPEYQTEAMKFLGRQYPPLKDVLANAQELARYENWLMLCCRSRIENIVKGVDRPEKHPGRVVPFTAQPSASNAASSSAQPTPHVPLNTEAPARLGLGEIHTGRAAVEAYVRGNTTGTIIDHLQRAYGPALHQVDSRGIEVTADPRVAPPQPPLRGGWNAQAVELILDLIAKHDVPANTGLEHYLKHTARGLDFQRRQKE